MANATGKEMAAVTQPEQDPVLGEGGNRAGAGPNVAALPPVQTLPCQIRERQPMSLHTTQDSSWQHKEMLQRH